MLLLFFFVAYLVAWLFFITAGLIFTNTQFSTLSHVLVFMGAISPGLVAILITAKTQGADGVKLLIDKISFKNTSVMWYVFAITFIALIKGLAALVFFLLYNSWPQFGTVSWYVMLGAIAVSTWVQAGEEIGWRGYALTAKTAVLIAEKILAGNFNAGYQTPAMKYGEDLIMEIPTSQRTDV